MRSPKWAAGILLVALLCLTAAAQTNICELEWSRSWPEAPEAYIILHGTEPGVYTNSYSFPGTQLYGDVQAVPGITNYYTAIVFDSRYIDPYSNPCNEVAFFVAAPPPVKRPGKPTPADMIWIRVRLTLK